MSTTYSPTAEQPSTLARILLAPVAGVCRLVELTLPRNERGGRS